MSDTTKPAAPAAADKPAPTTALVPKEVAPPPVPIVGGTLKPDSLEGMWRLAQIVAKSGICPDGVKTYEQAFVVLMAGSEIGLSPMQSLQGIMVVNNRPSVWGDAALALVQSSGLLVDIEETFEYDAQGLVIMATCRVVRKDRPTPIVRSFTFAEAQAAGLTNKAIWKQYRGRMLQMRARSFALRDAFPDVLKGLSVAEEQQDVEPKTSAAAVVSSKLAGHDIEDATNPVANPDDVQDAQFEDAKGNGQARQREPGEDDDEGDGPVLTTRTQPKQPDPAGGQPSLPGIDAAAIDAAFAKGKK